MPIRAAVGAVCLLALALLSTGPARAEDAFELDLFRPRIELWGANVPDKEFTDLPAEEFGQRTAGLAVNVPLGPTRIDTEGRIMGRQFFAELRAQSSPTTLTLVGRDPRLNSGAARLVGVFLGSGGNLYVAALGASFAEDDETDGIRGRFSGVGLATHRTSSGLLLIYGGAASYQYGRALALPVFGLNWKMAENWTLFTVVPVLVKTTWTRSDRMLFHFGAGVSGDRYRFANLGTFPGEPDEIYLRLTQLGLSAEAEYRPSRDHSFLAEVGVRGARQLEFTRSTDADDTIFEADLEPSGYARLAWRFRFGKSLVDQLGEQGGP